MLDQFGSHIQRSSQNQIKTCFLIKLLGESEVSNLDIEIVYRIWHKKDIFWFDISVGYRLEVHVIEAQHDLMNNISRLSLSKAC